MHYEASKINEREIDIHTGILTVLGAVQGGPSEGPKVLRHTITPPLPGVQVESGEKEVPEEILPWKGSIFSVYSRAAADWEGGGYGPLLMTPSVRHM